MKISITCTQQQFAVVMSRCFNSKVFECRHCLFLGLCGGDDYLNTVANITVLNEETQSDVASEEENRK